MLRILPLCQKERIRRWCEMHIKGEEKEEEAAANTDG
jgi:hypothetical protein